MKRYKRRPKRERWLYVLDIEPLKKRGGLKVGTTRHRIQQKVQLREEEKIIPAYSFEERSIRDTLYKYKVFPALWSNWGGTIRLTVNGWQGDRRIKEIIHLAYHKEHWEKQEQGYHRFRQWIVAAIASNLRRRGLRLSNPKESQGRIDGLRQELNTLQRLTEYVPPERMGAHVNQVKWKAEAIQKQKRTKQLTQATIRIEKLV
jgi:hypothetical protein